MTKWIESTVLIIAIATVLCLIAGAISLLRLDKTLSDNNKVLEVLTQQNNILGDLATKEDVTNATKVLNESLSTPPVDEMQYLSAGCQAACFGLAGTQGVTQNNMEQFMQSCYEAICSTTLSQVVLN